MQDVVIGFENFDKRLIIKTNDESKVHELFCDGSVRGVFQNLENFTFGITTHHTSGSTHRNPNLELNIETGITDVNKLRQMYKAFYAVLIGLDKE